MVQQRIRNRLNSAQRRVFSVLAVCWLNLAIMPCATAFAVEDDCPHCQPAADQHMAHHGHHDVETTSDSGTMQPDCCDVDDSALDSRVGKFEGQNDVAVIATEIAWPLLQLLSSAPRDTRPPDPGNFSPPLHKLFCVYLD